MDGRGGAAKGQREQREVLQIVGSRVGVRQVVGRHAVDGQIDSQVGVAVNGVAEDGVAGARVRREGHAASVEGDHIAQTAGALDLVGAAAAHVYAVQDVS